MYACIRETGCRLFEGVCGWENASPPWLWAGATTPRPGATCHLNDGRKEDLRGVRSGTIGGSRDMCEAASRDSGGTEGLDAGWFVGDRTTAMVGTILALNNRIGYNGLHSVLKLWRYV